MLDAGIFNFSGVLILAVGDTLKLVIQTFFYAILLQVVLSWVQPASNANYVLMQFTSPIMRPLHRIVPNVGGFDITPIPALLLLQLLQIVIVSPVMSMGYSTVFS
jgi:YggT family protein